MVTKNSALSRLSMKQKGFKRRQLKQRSGSWYESVFIEEIYIKKTLQASQLEGFCNYDINLKA